MKAAKAPRARQDTRRRKEKLGVQAVEAAAPDPVVEGRRLDRKRAGLLFLLAFLVFNANLRPISAGDCFPARFLPFSLWGRAA